MMKLQIQTIQFKTMQLHILPYRHIRTQYIYCEEECEQITDLNKFSM